MRLRVDLRSPAETPLTPLLSALTEPARPWVKLGMSKSKKSEALTWSALFTLAVIVELPTGCVVYLPVSLSGSLL